MLYLKLIAIANTRLYSIVGKLELILHHIITIAKTVYTNTILRNSILSEFYFIHLGSIGTRITTKLLGLIHTIRREVALFKGDSTLLSIAMSLRLFD